MGDAVFNASWSLHAIVTPCPARSFLTDAYILSSSAEVVTLLNARQRYCLDDEALFVPPLYALALKTTCGVLLGSVCSISVISAVSIDRKYEIPPLYFRYIRHGWAVSKAFVGIPLVFSDEPLNTLNDPERPHRSTDTCGCQSGDRLPTPKWVSCPVAVNAKNADHPDECDILLMTGEYAMSSLSYKRALASHVGSLVSAPVVEPSWAWLP